MEGNSLKESPSALQVAGRLYDPLLSFYSQNVLPKDPELVENFERLKLRTSSDPFYDSESSKLHAFKEECKVTCAEIAFSVQQIQSDILTSIHRVAELECLRAFKEQKGTICSSILGSISILPTEILGEIFLNCLPPMPSPDVREAPLLLCQVSASWRDIARNLPRLWNNLCIPYHFKTMQIDRPITFRHLPQISSFWIEGVRNLPLILSLNVSAPNALEALAHVLVTHAHRVGSLNICADTFSDVAQLLREPELVLPVLVSCSLVTKMRGDAEIFAPEIVPALQRLTIVVFPNNPLGACLPWAQLTHLHVPAHNGALYLPTWPVILRECTRLQEVVVSLRTPYRTKEGLQSSRAARVQSTERLPHLALEKLELSVVGLCDLPTLFEGFTFPALKSLKLYATKKFFNWSVYTRFTEELRDLTLLTLSNVDITLHDLIAVPKSNLSLQNLSLNMNYDEADISILLATLTADADQNGTGNTQVVCPNLKTMRLLTPVSVIDSSSDLLFRASRLVNSRRKATVDSMIILTFYVPIRSGHELDAETISNIRSLMHGLIDDGRMSPSYAHVPLQIEGVHVGFRI